MNNGRLTLLLIALYAMPALPQGHGFSKTELKQMKQLPKSAKGSGACASFEATFTSPLREKPTAMVDVEKKDLIEGTVSQVMEVIAVNPSTYRMTITSPTACEAIRTEKSPVSVTVTEGLGADNRPLFPTERSFKIK